MSEPPYPLHPSVINRINPEYRDFYNKHVFDKQVVHRQPISASRASGTLIPGAGPKVEVASVEDITIPRKETTGPDILIRAFTPLGERPTKGWPLAFWFHGGGWVLGNIDTENVIATHLCNRAKCAVICVDYRLAPEDPFPAAVDDCWESLLWAVSAGIGRFKLDASRIAIGGSSAGGNLTAVMCQRATQRSDIPPIAVQLLSVPVADNTATTDSQNPDHASWKENEFTPALPAEKMMWYRLHYLPVKETWQHPEASPLLWEGDWSKLPPAVVVVGELDVLRSEGEALRKKLQDAGVQVDLHVMKGQPHPFIAMDEALEDGRRAITLFCNKLLELL
ncbi:alpha/beta hydrolase fold-domain-containing protein [Colletotrichum navitas]|uniref:Alpha/beta hydrolase fold-domain-containing protein n=1 Tax=Colletotrichum navitas TaxID=681940 RepID=A0AAD8PYL3_9PEZI|nr:alpha/beta hydrolase fold-domain-containing protein [Colletotrichum navitas]KAK1590503.1 alpha/beta hydrolase fold-domain-containing protein [Colletotrichum navitas]